MAVTQAERLYTVDQAARILGAGASELLGRNQRKQIVRATFRVQMRADGIVNGAKIDHDGGFEVAKRNSE